MYAFTYHRASGLRQATNMLGKLGFSSRTQIAAWSVEKGLAGERAP